MKKNTFIEMAQTSNSRKKHNKKNDWLMVNPYIIAGIIGASFCFSWFFSVLTFPQPVFIENADPLGIELLHFTFIAALLLGYMIIWRLSDWFQKHRAFLVLIAFVCATANSWGWGVFAVDLIALYVVFALVGFGVASLMTLWAEFLCSLLNAQVRVFTAATLALSFVWYSVIIIVEPEIVPYVISVYALISASVYLYLKRNFSLMDTFPEVSSGESDDRLQISRRSTLLTVMGSFGQGFALYWIIMPGVHNALVLFLIGVFSFVVFFLLFVDSFRSLFLKESFIRRLMLPVLAACIMTLFFLPQEFWIGPCLLAFLFSLMPYASAIFAICEHVVRSNLSAIRVFSWGRLPAAFGLLAGLTFGWLAFSSNILGDITLPVWVVVFVMLFILVTAVLSTESYYPGEESSKDVHKVGHVGANGELSFTGNNKAEGSEKKYFHLKCNALAEKYSLSKRQTEVLYYLAKGRNAKHIEEQLVVSHHTAKAHIYNIYQKTGAHSQQELIDLIDNTVIDINKN